MKRTLKKGMVVRVISDGPLPHTEFNPRHPNVGAIARITDAGRPDDAYDCVRVDGGPPWRQSCGWLAHGEEERAFFANELEPLDEGIAALYGVDEKET